MVFQWFFYMWTIGTNGFSMVFLHVNHWCQWFFNGFFRSQPFVSMVFPMVFYNRTIAIEWMVCGSPFTSMVYQWFWGKWTLVHKKRPKRKKTWFVQQKHRGKQTLDRLTWPNVTKVAVEQLKRLGAAVGRHQGCDEKVSSRQLFQRLSLTLMRGKAALITGRRPDDDIASATVDGIE